MKDYDIFYDNGKWVAIREGKTRRNIAPHNCQTKKKAMVAAQEDRDYLKSQGIKPSEAD